MRRQILLLAVTFAATSMLVACEVPETEDRTIPNEVVTDVAPSQIPGEPATPATPADTKPVHESFTRCLGTWLVEADSGKFDRDGYTFTIVIKSDSLFLNGFTGQLQDGGIGYALSDLTPSATGWSGPTSDGYLRNETMWKFTSETTAIMDVRGYRIGNDEFLGTKRLFLTKK